jgi:hypothetical protein
MSTKTKTELAVAVLHQIGVIDAAESPTVGDVDVDFVIDAYEDKFEQLAAPGRELVYWPRDSIPGAVFLALRDLIINEVREPFGEPMSPEDKEARETIILKQLKRHMRREATGNPVYADYF